VNGVRGLYRSTDQAASWMRVNDDAHEYGGPGNGQFVQGDMNVFGRVYLSTAGRGIVYGDDDTILSNDVVSNNQVNFAMYPNPVKDGKFKIDLPTGMAHANILIFDLIGKLIYQQNSEGHQNVEIRTTLKAGMYVVKVLSRTVDLTRKLIVK
jgi:hypothetical protein